MKDYQPQSGLLNDSLAANIIRFGCYTIVLMIFFLSLPKLVEFGDITIFKEHGVIEWMQIKLLALAGVLFLLAARAFAAFRHSMILLTMVCGYATIRELDGTLDELVPLVGWKFGLLLAPAAAWYAYKHRQALQREGAHLITTRAFGMLWVAFVVAVPFGQLVGHGSFLQMVMGGEYTRHYKRVIEELCELMGYMLILIGSIEMHVQLRSLAPAHAVARASAMSATRGSKRRIDELSAASGD